MRRLLAVLALALGAAVPAGATAGSIEEVIDRELPGSRVPGLAYAVVTEGEVTTAGTRGVLRLGEDALVRRETPFLTGSVSKSFTALAVMQLVEAGAVDLDAPVGTYLAGFSGGPGDAVTIRQLLSHTSGYSTLQGNAAPEDVAEGGADELARRVDQLAGQGPAGTPGEAWAYSNANYEILGRVVEVLSGQDYQRYVADNILTPLGMDDSFVADGLVHDEMATGHRPWFFTRRPLPEKVTSRRTAPAGGIVASAPDLAQYLAVMMNGRDDVLSAEGKAAMMRPASPVSPFYGFGWFVNESDGTVWHTGTSPGYESTATMVPARHAAAVVLVNAGSGVGFGETSPLRNAITSAALGLGEEGKDSRRPQQALFLGLLALPVLYVIAMVWAWRHRAALRAKSGPFGLFSLWFPLLTTAVAAGVILWLAPTLLGSPLRTLAVYQPDLGVALVATAATGVLWAVFRFAVAHTGGSRRA